MTLIYLLLFTDCPMKVSPQSLEQNKNTSLQIEYFLCSTVCILQILQAVKFEILSTEEA